jgi:hypothetical protein
VEHERRLAGAVRTQDRNPLARIDLEVEAVQRYPPVGVGEPHSPHRHRRAVRLSVHATTQAAAAKAHAANGSTAGHQPDAEARRPSSAGMVPS